MCVLRIFPGEHSSALHC